MEIKCGKFDDTVLFNFDEKINYNERIRIGSHNPSKLSIKKFTPIATNGKIIIYQNIKYDISIFCQMCIKENISDLYFLTTKERDLALEIFLDFNINVRIFELSFPVFENIKYSSNTYFNYSKLLRLLKSLKTLELNKSRTLGDYLTKKNLFKIERKLRLKNKYDKFFFHAYKSGYQEVFKLTEDRADKIIIALDFNSMYASCSLDAFIEPKSIKYMQFDSFELSENNSMSKLHNGLYRVVLKNPLDTFFKSFHPFKYTKLFHSFYFNLEYKHELEILLFKNEIEYYSKFFEKTIIKDGLVSSKELRHPLADKIKQAYNDRVHYKQINDSINANLCKFYLSSMHSSTNRIKYKTLIFDSIDEVKNYLLNIYNIDLKNKTADELKYLKSNKFFKVTKEANKIKCKFIDIESSFAIYSLSSQILANTHLKMLKTIESLLEFESLEICYCNVDSIHISIDKNKLDNFLKKFDYLISNELGKLKIETIADQGYWFDIGRYWLFKNSEVVQFKNVIFNTSYNQKKFNKYRKIKIVAKSKDFNYVKEKHAYIHKSFSYSKRLMEDLKYSRYNFTEISNLDVAYSKTINNEILQSCSVKSVLLNKIATD